MRAWKAALEKDEAVDHIVVTAGTKRKAVSAHVCLTLWQLRQRQDVDVDEAEMRSRWQGGTLDKVRECVGCFVGRLTCPTAKERAVEGG